MDKKTKVATGFVMVITVILAISIGGALWWGASYFIKNKVNYIPVSKVIPDLETNNIAVVVEDEPINIKNKPKIVDDIIYFPLDYVKKYIDDHFYWDEKEKILSFTTVDEVYKFRSNETTYFINNNPFKLKMPVKLYDGVLYIPVTFLLEHFDIDLQLNTELNLIIMDYKKNIKTYGEIKGNKVYLRYKPSRKSPIINKLIQQEEIVVYKEDNEFFKVRTKEGLIGYVKKKEVHNIRKIYPKYSNKQTVKNNVKKVINGKLNVVWHQVFSWKGNAKVKEAFKNVKGLDVISPTWFSLSDSKGNIESIADKWYVTWAHQQGYQIWALFKNGFDSKITHDVLSSTSKRQKVINYILALAKTYKLDGINIDFENVDKKDGEYFVQFIRELAPILREQNIVVSVDCYVPSAWTAHYNREELAKIVDYIMIMAYDEHWSTSPESGSVASIGFVERAIQKTLKEVPKEKILLGIPYYTRLWKEQKVNDKIKVTSKAYGMDDTYNILKENNADIHWDNQTEQYYGEFNKDGAVYKIWLEEEKSIEKKLKLVGKYKLAGISGWKKGLEKDQIWDLLYQYLKGNRKGEEIHGK